MAGKVALPHPYPYFVPQANPSQPLVVAVASQDWPAVLARLETSEGVEEAKTVDWDGWFPLHHACAAGPALPKKVVLALLNAYPQSARVPEQHGELPIDIARRSGGSEDVIQLLTQAYPAGAKRNDYSLIFCGQ